MLPPLPVHSDLRWRKKESQPLVCKLAYAWWHGTSHDLGWRLRLFMSLPGICVGMCLSYSISSHGSGQPGKRYIDDIGNWQELTWLSCLVFFHEVQFVKFLGRYICTCICHPAAWLLYQHCGIQSPSFWWLVSFYGDNWDVLASMASDSMQKKKVVCSILANIQRKKKPWRNFFMWMITWWPLPHLRYFWPHPLNWQLNDL